MSDVVFSFDGPPRLEVHRSAGESTTMHWIEQASGRPGVVIVAERPDGAILLIRQWRPSVRTRLWQLPRGHSEPTDVDPCAAAQRELAEETGARATDCEVLGTIYIDPGVTTATAHVVLCEVQDAPANQSAQSLQAEHIDKVAWVSPAERAHWITDGRLTDGISLAALMLLTTRRRPPAG